MEVKQYCFMGYFYGTMKMSLDALSASDGSWKLYYILLVKNVIMIASVEGIKVYSIVKGKQRTKLCSLCDRLWEKGPLRARDQFVTK